MQACALTGNWTRNLLIHRLALNSLSHTNQGHTTHILWHLLLPHILYLPVLLLSVAHLKYEDRETYGSSSPPYLEQCQSTSLEGSQEARKNLVKYYLRKNNYTICRVSETWREWLIKNQRTVTSSLISDYPVIFFFFKYK